MSFLSNGIKEEWAYNKKRSNQEWERVSRLGEWMINIISNDWP